MSEVAYSISPSGEQFEIPGPDEYKKEFARLKRLVKKNRDQGREIVVVVKHGKIELHGVARSKTFGIVRIVVEKVGGIDRMEQGGGGVVATPQQEEENQERRREVTYIIRHDANDANRVSIADIHGMQCAVVMDREYIAKPLSW